MELKQIYICKNHLAHLIGFTKIESRGIQIITLENLDSQTLDLNVLTNLIIVYVNVLLQQFGLY